MSDEEVRLSVIESKQEGLREDIGEIKQDVKDIKSLVASQFESIHNTQAKNYSDLLQGRNECKMNVQKDILILEQKLEQKIIKIESKQKIMWGIISGLGAAIVSLVVKILIGAV